MENRHNTSFGQRVLPLQQRQNDTISNTITLRPYADQAKILLSIDHLEDYCQDFASCPGLLINSIYRECKQSCTDLQEQQMRMSLQ